MKNNTSKIKVIGLLAHCAYPLDRRFASSMESLVQAGYRVAVISPKEADQVTRETIKGVHVYRFSVPNFGDGVLSYIIEFIYLTLAAILLTLWVWLREGMDIFHYNTPPDSLFMAGVLPKLAGKSLIYDVRDLAPELYESKYEKTNPILLNMLLLLEKCAARIANHVLVVNESYRQVIIKRDGVRPERVTIVRYGPDLNRILLTDPDPTVRSRAPIIIAFLGMMAKQDGIDFLLRSLHHLLTLGYQDWFCVLIGPVEHPAFFNKLAKDLEITDRVWFPGIIHTPEWVPYLAAADICVDPAPANPLNNKSTMVKLMDYMTLKKPAVAFDLPESRITAGGAALFARPNDEIDFARQIACLIDNPEMRQQMGALGRERMEKELCWPHQQQRLLQVYESISLRISHRR